MSKTYRSEPNRHTDGTKRARMQDIYVCNTFTTHSPKLGRVLSGTCRDRSEQRERDALLRWLKGKQS